MIYKKLIWNFIGLLSCCYLSLGIQYGSKPALQQLITSKWLIPILVFSLLFWILEIVIKKLFK